MLSCAIVVIIISTVFIVFEYFTFKNTIEYNLRTLASVAGANSSGALAFDTPKDAVDNLKALKAEPHVVAAALYTTEGKLFASYPPDIDPGLLPPKPGNPGYHSDNNFMYGFDSVFQNNTPLGMIYIKSDMGVLYDQLQLYGWAAFVVFLLSLPIAYLLSRYLQTSISRPILNLEQTAKKIAEEGDYSVRANITGDDEIGLLTRAFNQMLSTIELQNQEIRAFNETLEKTIVKRTSALQEANETLTRQKEFVETIINSSVDIIGVFDKDLNYVMLNKRADEYYGFKQEDIIGKNILEVYPQLANSEMISDLNKALAGNIVTNSKYKSDIVNRYFENYYIPLKDTDGKVYGVLTIAHDITSIMESHEKLTQLNNALIKSNDELEQFAYVASHDLQEPLRKIQVFTQLISEEPGNAAYVNKYQEKINQSAFRMQELINDVLNFSRVSKNEDRLEKVDLNKIIAAILVDFELAIQEKQAHIHFQKLPVIEGVPLQLSQLFSNLLSNSLKYSKEKPIITIESDPVINNSVTIRFTDNGIGFEEQYNEKIFTIFKRLHGRQSYSGTGIGLALCRKIVENHKGSITASGKLNTGATFTITLPTVQG